MNIVPNNAGYFDNVFIEFNFRNWDQDMGYATIILVDTSSNGGIAKKSEILKISPGTTSFRITEDGLYTNDKLIVPWLDSIDYLIIASKDAQGDISDFEVRIRLYDSGISRYTQYYRMGNSLGNDDIYRVFEINFVGNPTYREVSQWEYASYPNGGPTIYSGRSVTSWTNFHNSFKTFVTSELSYPYIYVENLLETHSFENPITH